MTTEEGARLKAYALRGWRKAKGKRGTSGLADAMGVTRQTVTNWFAGKQNPSLDHLAAMAKVLRVTRWEIVAAIEGAPLVSVSDEETRALVQAEVLATLRGLGHQQQR